MREMIKPTIAEVENYCLERGNKISAKSFINYYESVGWVVGKNKKMKDWKAAVRTWEQKDDERKVKSKSTGSIIDRLSDRSWAE
jgi:archaellum component FlaD/FlaE